MDDIESLVLEIAVSHSEIIPERATINTMQNVWKYLSIEANGLLRRTVDITRAQTIYHSYIEITKLTMSFVGAYLVFLTAIFVILFVYAVIQACRIHYRSEKSLYSSAGRFEYFFLYSFTSIFTLIIIAISIFVGLGLSGFSVLIGEYWTLIKEIDRLFTLLQ